jgi:hypothetical protein
MSLYGTEWGVFSKTAALLYAHAMCAHLIRSILADMGIKVSDIRFQHNNRKSDFDWVSILLILVAIGIIVGTILFIFYFRASELEEILETGQTVSWVFIENNGEKTETVLLYFYNPKTKKLASLVMPPRTRLKVEYEDKPAYDILGNIYFRGGPLIVKKTVEKLTGNEFDFYLAYDLACLLRVASRENCRYRAFTQQFQGIQDPHQGGCHEYGQTGPEGPRIGDEQCLGLEDTVLSHVREEYDDKGGAVYNTY